MKIKRKIKPQTLNLKIPDGRSHIEQADFEAVPQKQIKLHFAIAAVYNLLQ